MSILGATIVNCDAVDTIAGKRILNSTGSILQVVTTTKTDTFNTTSSSMTDVTGLSCAITPSSSANKVIINYSVHMGNSDSYWLAAGDFTRGGTRIDGMVGAADGVRGRFTFGTQEGGAIHGDTRCYAGSYLDSPGTTGSVTYQVRIRSEGGRTVWINRGYEADGNADVSQRCISMITLMEVSG